MKTKQILCAALSLLLLTALSVPVCAEAGAPIAENMKLSTYRGVSMEGQLKATDPEGDVLTYQLTTPPAKGDVLIEEDGSFIYTPREGKRGKDYFGYTATDTNGNVSQEATVIITLMKQETSVTYPDMIGTGGYYDALRLAEAGIFTGEQIGSEYIFSPTTSVTRGEFLAMCMELTDTPILSGVSSTGFADDELIPTWQKSYVATALMNGSISAMSETGSATFDANSPITCAQAAVMVSSIFNLSKVTTFAADDSTPTWASQAVANLTACDILPENADTNQTLNRGMTADILSSVMDVLESR